MKRLTCEICGSTDLIKQDGVFVCQSCGCKYTVEEVKKMMIEGTVDVSGSTVKVDTSAKLQNLYTLARRAKDENNVCDAAAYYREIRMEDPHSWEAAFYGTFFDALDCKVGEIELAARSITNAIPTVSKMIGLYVPAEEQEQAYTEVLKRVLVAGEILCGGAEKALQDSGVLDCELIFDPDARRYTVRPDTDVDKRIKADFVRRTEACDIMIATAGEAAETTFENYKLAEIIYKYGEKTCENRILFIRRNLGYMYETASQVYLDVFKESLDGLKPKLLELQLKRNERYWTEHIEEKKKFEVRIAEIESEIQQLTAQLKPYDAQIAEIKKELDGPNSAESQLVEFKKRQADLTTQKSQLGLFAGKQKKELQTQIDALQVEIDAADATAKRLKKELQDDVDVRIAAVEAERKPLLSRIGELEEELRRINFELTKDR